LEPEEESINKNGTFKGVFDLDKDASYEFKYIIDGTMLI
jgi:hypothetical protein